MTRPNAWQRLGYELRDESTTTLAAMTDAHLRDWNVRKVPLLALLDTGSTLKFPDAFAVVRDNPIVPEQIDLIARVGSKYAVQQNEEYAPFIDALIKVSDFRPVLAGQLEGGRRAFVALRWAACLLVAINCHDGSAPFTLMRCGVTPNGALINVDIPGGMAYTSSARIGSWMEPLKEMRHTRAWMQQLVDLGDRMRECPMTEEQFRHRMNTTFGPEPDAAEATRTRWANKLEGMCQILRSEQVPGTAWDYFLTVCEWVDHHAPVRNATDLEEKRALRAVFAPKMKQAALHALLLKI